MTGCCAFTEGSVTATSANWLVGWGRPVATSNLSHYTTRLFHSNEPALSDVRFHTAWDDDRCLSTFEWIFFFSHRITQVRFGLVCDTLPHLGGMNDSVSWQSSGRGDALPTCVFIYQTRIISIGSSNNQRVGSVTGRCWCMGAVGRLTAPGGLQFNVQNVTLIRFCNCKLIHFP